MNIFSLSGLFGLLSLLMNITETIHNSWHLIGRNKVRSFLTMLGVIIGVMSFIIIISVGAGAQSLILNQIKSMGSNLIGVLPGKSDEKGPPASVFGVVITTLKYEDGKAIMSAGHPHILGFAAYARGKDTVTRGEDKLDTNFVGTTASYIDIEDAAPAAGRFFDAEEEKTSARVAVLGSKTAEELFGRDDPLGEKIKIKKTTFTIIGVMAKRGMSGFQNQDNQIIIPITAAQKLLLGIDYVNFMRLKVDREEYMPDAAEFIVNILREQHNIADPAKDDFSVRSMAEGLAMITNVTNALRLFLVAIAVIALFVGGIGIMNIMLAAVQERTQEIGLRKAVGAESGDIMRQFLTETSLITFIAGAIGIVLGIAVSVLIAWAAKNQGYNWDLVISPISIILGCAVSIIIGLIFGVVPARRASRLDPITALRYE